MPEPTSLGPHLLGRKPSPPDVRDYAMGDVLPVTGPAGPSWIRSLLAWLQKMLHPKTPPGPPPPSPPAPADYIRASTTQLDQGNTGHCVGFGTAHWLAADPVMDDIHNADGHTIYYECKILDGEPNAEDGSYVRTAAKAMVNRSRMGSYYFASTVDEIAAWLRSYGPVIMGTDWHESMFSPDATGLVDLDGHVAGGHCWIVIGQLRDGTFLCQNSWGSGWGIGGRFRIRRDDLAVLLAADGEACGAAELPA